MTCKKKKKKSPVAYQNSDKNICACVDKDRVNIGVERSGLSAACPSTSGRFLSPASGCDASPRRLFHSLSVSLSAHDLTTASETDVQIPGRDKGKMNLIYRQWPLEACH